MLWLERYHTYRDMLSFYDPLNETFASWQSTDQVMICAMFKMVQQMRDLRASWARTRTLMEQCAPLLSESMSDGAIESLSVG